MRSALARYVYYNLKFPDWLSEAVKFGSAAETSATTVSEAQKTRLMTYYFSELRNIKAANTLKVTLLLDGHRKAIYSDTKDQTHLPYLEDRNAVISMATASGFKVVDMQPVFENHWAEHKERMDYLPADWHWNPVAHRLAAEALLLHL